MTDVSKTPAKKVVRRQLVNAALATLERQGYKIARVRGGGKGRIRRISKNGTTQLAAIRTTQDMWLAFPRNEDDTKWVTLSDVDVVVVASVDDPAKPKLAKVHIIEAKAMRDRFDRAYAARNAAGHTIPLGRGVWLSLYDDEGTTPVQRVGAGMGNVFPPVELVSLSSEPSPVGGGSPTSPSRKDANRGADDEAPLTIAEAKRRLALAFGVDPSSIKITVEA